MKSKKPAVNNPKPYIEVIKLMQEKKIANPTWSETWIFGSWNYYQSKLTLNQDLDILEQWWSGVIKAYNKKNGIK
jgi:hypothetical protein